MSPRLTILRLSNGSLEESELAQRLRRSVKPFFPVI